MITSARNPRIRAVKELLEHSQARREAGVFVIEGVRLVEEAILSGCYPRELYYTDEISPRGWELIWRCQEVGTSVEQVSPRVMSSSSGTQTPQGLLAVVPIQPLPVPHSPDFILILDGLRDPGNLGTILRTATAAGVQAVLLTPGSADPYAPKVVRAAMGAHFRLPIQVLDWGTLRSLLRSDEHQTVKVYLADAHNGPPYTQTDFRSPLALVVGGEAEGAGRQALDLADSLVHIPMPGKVESLNAAVAAAILMFEVVRQRSL